MSSLTFELLTDAGPTVSYTKTFGVAVEARFSDWLWAKHPPLDGNGDPLPDTPANRAQAFRNWSDNTMLIAWQNVKNWEEAVAAEAARDGVPDMEFD